MITVFVLLTQRVIMLILQMIMLWFPRKWKRLQIFSEKIIWEIVIQTNFIFTLAKFVRLLATDRYFVQFISLMRSIMLKMPFRHLKTVSLLNSLTQSENPVIHRLSIFRMYIQQEIFNIRTSRLPLHSAKAFFAITACAVFTAVDLQVQFRRLSKMNL